MISTITEIDNLLEEYRERKQFPLVDEQHYWTFLDSQDELQYSEFYYFPEAHYNRAIREALEEEFEDEPQTLESQRRYEQG